MFPFEIAGAAALGWAIGNSDSANTFGTAVASQSIRFGLAIALCAVFIVAGGLIGGMAGIATLGALSSQSIQTAFIASLSSALCIALFSLLGFSPSASHCIVGAVVGIGAARMDFRFTGLEKIALSWVLTPVLGCLAALLFSFLLGRAVNRLKTNIFTLDKLIRYSLFASSAYAAFALGANNTAAAAGVFAASGAVTPFFAALVGSASIALGALCARKRLFLKKAGRLIRLDSFSALVAILAEAVTVHFFSLIGVPVSSGQALTGALLGIGLHKGMQTINLRTLFFIVASWVVTPLVSGGISFLLARLSGA